MRSSGFSKTRRRAASSEKRVSRPAAASSTSRRRPRKRRSCMLNSSANRLNVWAALGAGVAIALAFLAFLPFAERNSALLLVLPFACALFLVIVLDPRLMAVGLLMTRVMLDPLLEKTRFDGGLGL